MFGTENAKMPNSKEQRNSNNQIKKSKLKQITI